MILCLFFYNNFYKEEYVLPFVVLLSCSKSISQVTLPSLPISLCVINIVDLIEQDIR